jgi:hypothetical protein
MSTIDAAVTPEPEVITARRAVRALLRDSIRLWRTRVGLLLVLLVVAIAALGPLLAPHGAQEFVGTPNTGPSPDALFGTDNLECRPVSRPGPASSESSWASRPSRSPHREQGRWFR